MATAHMTVYCVHGFFVSRTTLMVRGSKLTPRRNMACARLTKPSLDRFWSAHRSKVPAGRRSRSKLYVRSSLWILPGRPPAHLPFEALSTSPAYLHRPVGNTGPCQQWGPGEGPDTGRGFGSDPFRRAALPLCRGSAGPGTQNHAGRNAFVAWV